MNSFIKGIAGAFVNIEDVPQEEGKKDKKPEVKTEQKPVIKNPEPIVYNTSPTVVANSVLNPTNAITITQEDKDKYQKYFLGLYNSLNDEKPSYHEFISMVEVINGNTSPADFYPKVFNGFQIQGLKKDTLLTTAKSTLEAIKQDAVNFNNKMQDKVTNEIGAKRKTIEQKQKEILDLQNKIAQLGNEINQLNVDVAGSEEKIKNGLAVYNVFSKEITTKIERDIQNIETFIN